jgi:hypothetical protein
LNKKFLIITSLIFLFILSLCIYPAWKIYQSKGKCIQIIFDDISKRQLDNSVTVSDKLLLRAVYAGMIYGGYPVYPEASMILKEYLYGNNDTLKLPGKYFKTSRFIRSKINKINSRTIGPIFIRLPEDKRIAYAINGFFIRVTDGKKGRHFRLFQDIVFSNDVSKKVVTSFRIFGLKIVIPDRLVHIVRTRKNEHLFVFSEWEER